MSDHFQYIHRLASGGHLPAAVFEALLNDPQAAHELASLLACGSLFDPPEAEDNQQLSSTYPKPANQDSGSDPDPDSHQGSHWEELAEYALAAPLEITAEDLACYLEGQPLLPLQQDRVEKLLRFLNRQTGQPEPPPPKLTELWMTSQTARLQYVLDEYQIPASVLKWVGIDPDRTADFRSYIDKRILQLDGSRRFREAMACWVSEFAHTHNLPLARPLTPEEWPGLIERCVLVTSLKSIPEGEPTWARDFRDHALSQQVSTVGELKMLEVPEEIRSQAGFVDFRRDLIKQLQQRHDQTKAELGL